MMIINNIFELKEIVYCVTDPEQSPRIITSIRICCDGGIIYCASIGSSTADFYECELCREENLVLKTK